MGTLFSCVAKRLDRWKKPSKKSSDATPTCKLCFHNIRPYGFRGAVFGREHLCSRCLSEFEPKNIYFSTNGVRGLAVYEYNQAIKSALFRFKGCFDYELKDVFLDHQAPILRMLYPGYTIVPAPSSKNHDDERGFNHVREMFSCLGLPMIHAIEKTDDRKQSDLDYRSRQEVGKHLRWVGGRSVSGKKILLVDDVYTTGATARNCIKLLKKHGASKIRVLVMAKTKGPHEPS